MHPDKVVILLVLVVEIVTGLMLAVHRVLTTVVMTEHSARTVTECVMVVKVAIMHKAVAPHTCTVRVQKVAGLVKDVTITVRQVVMLVVKA